MFTMSVPLGINIIISHNNGNPQIELRRKVSDPELIKQIISNAFYEEITLVLPKFNDRLKSLNTLIDKGYLVKNDENGQLEFTF